MKQKLSIGLSILTAVAALSLAGPSQAVDTVYKNKNGSLRVTMEPSDSLVGLASFPSEECATGIATGVFAAEVEEIDSIFAIFNALQAECDVKNIRVAGLGGDNVLAILGIDIPQGLDIRGGQQDDTVLWYGDNSMGNLAVNLRGGNNTVNGGIDPVQLCFFGGYITLFPGSGVTDVTWQADMDFRGGHDDVAFFELNVGGMTTIDTGSGSDEVDIDSGTMNRLIVNTGNDDDYVKVANFAVHLLQVFTGKGGDTVEADDINASNTIDFVLGTDDDTFVADNIAAAFGANANGGSGTDSCTVGAGWAGNTDAGFEPAC